MEIGLEGEAPRGPGAGVAVVDAGLGVSRECQQELGLEQGRGRGRGPRAESAAGVKKRRGPACRGLQGGRVIGVSGEWPGEGDLGRGHRWRGQTMWGTAGRPESWGPRPEARACPPDRMVWGLRLRLALQSSPYSQGLGDPEKSPRAASSPSKGARRQNGFPLPERGRRGEGGRALQGGKRTTGLF